MQFHPPRCPYAGCPANDGGAPFPWCRFGRYRRRCDGREVPRFRCLTCRRTFSTQSFRVDHRLRKPWLDTTLLQHFVSKVTLRQSSRVLGVRLETVTRRHRRYGVHCRLLHAALLERGRAHGGLPGRFQLDELETYETDRRLRPVTVPVLVEASTGFVVSVSTAPLPSRGGLRPRDRVRRRLLEARVGRRRSGSRLAVERCLGQLVAARPKGAPIEITTDRKAAYPGSVRRLLGRRARHLRVSSKVRRDERNPLFRVNLTLAMLRDGVSRLVRRTWAAAKLRERLEDHLWIWVAWRNYGRRATTREARSPAQLLEVVRRRVPGAELLRWHGRFHELVLQH
ncbi:MAG TPA: hypothetical protein VJP77_00250 [Planctomycetota bacterium]|nr:hypothetical protein [Planctomycetota bacterium]